MTVPVAATAVGEQIEVATVMLPGFGNHVVTEALRGALPIDGNAPQHAHFALYAEQLSGTAFTVPRALFPAAHPSVRSGVGPD